MSGVKFRANTGQVALSAATAKTVLQIVAAANHRVRIDKIVASFEGATAGIAAAQVRLLKQTTAGTMSALTLVKDNADDGETLQTTAQHTATAEPTAGDVIESQFVPSYHGQRIFVGPFWINGGDRLGIEVTSAEAIDCIVSAYGDE